VAKTLPKINVTKLMDLQEDTRLRSLKEQVDSGGDVRAAKRRKSKKSVAQIQAEINAKEKLKKRKINPKKVFGKSEVTKVEPQQNMDSVMKSIANIQETLKKLQSIIITDAEEKKKETAKENRQLLLGGEKEERKKKEGLLEKVPERLKNALLSPVKAVGQKAKGILSRLMEAFSLIFTGWLADKGLKAIQAFMDGDKEKLKKIGMNVLAGVGIVGGIFVAMNFGILALPAIIAKVIGVIATVGSAIIGFLLSPPGLIMLAIAAGVGAAILGIKKIFKLGRDAQTGGGKLTEKHNELDQKLKDAGMDISGTNSAIRGSARRNIDPETGGRTEEQQKIYEEVEVERKRIRKIQSDRDAEIKTAEKEYRKNNSSRNNPNFQPGLKAIKNKITEKYEKLINPNSTTNISNSISSNNVNISNTTKNRNLSAIDEAPPKVTVNNLDGKKGGDQPLKSGNQSNVPLIASSNPNNFYSTYSQTQYGVVV